MGERVLYLVRHGQLDRAAKNQFAAGLTALGREQARVTAKRLHPMDVSAIYCSTLGRARETAEIIHAAFPTVALWNSTLLWELGNVGPSRITDGRRGSRVASSAARVRSLDTSVPHAQQNASTFS